MTDKRPGWPADHRVGLYIAVDDDAPLLVGTAKGVSDVPHMLQAVADRWHQREPDGVLLDPREP